MKSRRVEDSITNAKAALDSVEQNGELAYDICDGILTNIKAFIHSPEIWDKINKHENSVHQEFTRRLNKANEELKQKPPMEIWQDGMSKYMKLRHWKSLEMLNFFDKLSKEYDI